VGGVRFQAPLSLRVYLIGVQPPQRYLWLQQECPCIRLLSRAILILGLKSCTQEKEQSMLRQC